MSDPRGDAAERIQALAKGPKGDKGAPGETGMPRGQRRAVVWMFLANLVFIGAVAFGLFHSVSSNSQQRCASVEAEAQIPLPHPIAGNPSRIWEAHYEAIQQRRARQLGCR